MRAGGAEAHARTFSHASRLFGGAPIASATELFDRARAHVERVLESEPVFLTLDRAFHGKSTGALSLTANPEYRASWRRIGLRTTFVAAGDEAALARAVDAARFAYVDVRVAEGGAITLEERSVTNVAACFVEPIRAKGACVRSRRGSFARCARPPIAKGSPS